MGKYIKVASFIGAFHSDHEVVVTHYTISCATQNPRASHLDGVNGRTLNISLIAFHPRLGHV
jgi:hypothetical protein